MKAKSEFDKIVREFAIAARKRLTGRVKKIILFGSRARGDFGMGSDYDFLVIVDKRDKKIRNAVLEASVEIMNRYYELAAFIVWDEEEWLQKQHYPIGMNILREGVEI